MTSKKSFWKRYFPRMYDKRYWPVFILFLLFIFSLRMGIYPALMDINTAVEDIKDYDERSLFSKDAELADRLVDNYYKKVDGLYYSLAWPIIILCLMIVFPYLNAGFGWIK